MNTGRHLLHRYGYGYPQGELGQALRTTFTLKAKGIGLRLAMVKTLVEGQH
jgi:nitrogen fixation/metabolism regulation signal transduction histidine kinase